jgi:hypothetical protein
MIFHLTLPRNCTCHPCPCIVLCQFDHNEDVVVQTLMNFLVLVLIELVCFGLKREKMELVIVQLALQCIYIITILISLCTCMHYKCLLRLIKFYCVHVCTLLKHTNYSLWLGVA